jgi:hypothetical protein
MASYRPTHSSGPVTTLFALRRQLGRAVGLDRAGTGLDERVPSLRARLPADVRDAPGWDVGDDAMFSPVYRTDNEAALEIANQTVHGVLHLGWVSDGRGGHRGQLAVLVKPNGLLGGLYLAAIAPVRHVVVYPAMMRTIATLWQATARQVDVPTDIGEFSTLPRIDYSDAFVIPPRAHPDWTALEWARAVLQDAPGPTRARLRAGWAALGLRLDATSERSILGWETRRADPDTVLLGADSHIGMPGELLFTLRPEGLLFATFLHHRTSATRPVWAAVERTHVRTVRELLDRACVATERERAEPAAAD